LGLAQKTFPLTVRPYKWEGSYARWRTDAPHDPGLCADVRGGWLGADERLILRTCEVLGHPQRLLYDDHFPPTEQSGRGKNYRHVPFTWDSDRSHQILSADCPIADFGGFGLQLAANADSIDIHLRIKNSSSEATGAIDWAFCVITLECDSIKDPSHQRTVVFDGRRLRTFGELKIDGRMTIIPINGGEGFVPLEHQRFPQSPVAASASFVAVEASDKTHSIALGFEQSYNSYGCTGNMCIHADPYLGSVAPGREKLMRGKLYLIEGNANDALNRYRMDFKVG